MKKQKLLLLCMAMFMLVASVARSQTVFRIDQGKNYPAPNKGVIHLGSVSDRTENVIFSPECIYVLGTQDDGDQNKVFGWSSDWGNASLRIGWNCKSQTGIDLYAYIHLDGKRWIPESWRSSKPSTPSLIGRGFMTSIPIACGIHRSRDGIEFTAVQGSKTERVFIAYDNFPAGPGSYQYPYFGGTTPAPHRMYITFTK